MISNTDAQFLIQASFYFNELFKRTVLSAPLPVSATKTQMDILMALYSDGPMNMSTLSAKVYIAPEQATRAIHGLREKGLIASERNEENRRMVIVRLTDTAVLMLDDHMRDLNMTLQSNLDGLTDREIDELIQAASTITRLSQKQASSMFCQNPPSLRRTLAHYNKSHKVRGGSWHTTTKPTKS